MSDIQRFNLAGSGNAWLTPSDDGKCVEYADHERIVSDLRAQLAAVTAARAAPLKFPRNAGGLLKIHMLEEVEERAHEIAERTAVGIPNCTDDLRHIAYTLLALESLSAPPSTTPEPRYDD
jgi:hypothetical protein